MEQPPRFTKSGKPMTEAQVRRANKARDRKLMHDMFGTKKPHLHTAALMRAR